MQMYFSTRPVGELVGIVVGLPVGPAVVGCVIGEMIMKMLWCEIHLNTRRMRQKMINIPRQLWAERSGCPTGV